MRGRHLVSMPALALLAGLFVVAPAPPSVATPVALTDATYGLYGRVFPDPHGCMPRMKPFSPFAKGRVCALDFIQFSEMIEGLGFLQEKFPGFLELARLDEKYGNPEYVSAGLAEADLSHTPEPLWMVRVTDESVPDAGKKHFVFPLSIHGIERAGVEGGVRAIEDLATWGACERDAGASPACADEDPLPHPILETSPELSLTAGEVLKKASVYFIFPNPDGWRRGDRDNGFFYQRYNGNGVDLNRDWPSIGYTYEPYTPWSEPESRAFGEVLKSIKDKWAGGIDLHGQLIDRAFSFTLLGQGENDFGRNQATLDIVQHAWQDAEKRLAWSSLIKPNDAPADDQRMYGVQWGTVWDSIGYTTTGALGDWIGAPIGLDADVAIDNEMSLSHISNCGVGVCFIPEAEQLHVDGNKSLVYSMLNFSFRPEDNRFRIGGRVAYLDNPRVVSSAGSATVQRSVDGLKPQADLDALLGPDNEWTHEFDVLGLTDKVYDGGFKVNIRSANVGAVSPGAVASVVVQRQEKGEWETVNSYFNQSPIYLQAGQTVDVNEPVPGRWRVQVESPEPGLLYRVTIDFRAGPAWPNPGQRPYRVTNLKFFQDLNRFADVPLEAVTADDVLAGRVDLARFDSLVIADDMLPGYAEPARTGPAQATIALGPADASNPTYPCGAPTTTLDPPPPGCEAIFEWDVDATKNNQAMTVSLEWQVAVNDYDLYVERYFAHGDDWTPVAQSAGSADPEAATLLKPVPGRYRARAVNFASAEPFPASLTVSFSNEGATSAKSARPAADLKPFAAKLRAFAEGGGNLVLTDSALRLLAPMGIVDRLAIHDFAVYAGFIGFTSDGANSTYDDPLGRDVQRPGAAEGPGHRHQTYEPVPLGFDIGGETDNNTAPVWAVDQTAWEKAGGRTAGTTTGDQVSLGELKLGKGAVRVIGALLPMPTDRYFHPYGLANYDVTYSGYQVFQNSVTYKAPARVLGTKRTRPRPPLPATGLGEAVSVVGVALLGAALAMRRWRSRAS